MTLRSTVPLLAAAFILSMLTGCTGCEGVDAPDFTDAGVQSDCMLDSDCESGFLCMDGFCTKDATACAGNADCTDGDVCRNGHCADRDESGECDSDEACSAYTRCTTTLPGNDAECLVSAECAASEPGTACDDACWGHCISRPACDSDADCQITEQCDDAAKVCIPIGDCSVDSDCPTTASCIEGECTDNGDCAVDEDCDGTQSCIDGDCTRNGDCSVDSDCPDDQNCNDVLGVCERRDPCTSNEDCAADEVCDLDNDGGTCVVIGDCTTVNDCPTDPEIACLEGICTRAECGRDSDCDDGLFCNGAETCNPRVGCQAGSVPTLKDLASCANEECDEVRDILVITPINTRCADNSPCTDDICSPTEGCSNPLNDFTPAPGPVGDCERTVCLAGTVQIVPADDESPTDQGTTSDCRVAVCRAGARVLDVNDSETPVQGATDNCVAHVCQQGNIVEVAADSEVPPQVSAVDCQQEICRNKVVVRVADNSETLVQVSDKDCLTNVCIAGAPSTRPAAETLPQTSATDCVTNVCIAGVASTQPANETLAQSSATDCQREICRNGSPVREADNSEQLTQAALDDCVTNQCVNGAPSTVPAAEVLTNTSPTDCRREVCQNGARTTEAFDVEVPTQTSTADCRKQICQAGASVTINDDTEVLPQGPLNDCRAEKCVAGTPSVVAAPTQLPAPGATGNCKLTTCSGINVVTINDNADVPADVGCREGICTAGVPSTVVDDDNCVGAEVCFVSGVCEAPTPLSCKTDDGITSRKVLEFFPLDAIAPGARTGTTFVWDIAGVPVGGDPQAHVLTNPNSPTTAGFQATSPSANLVIKDYGLRVTMNEPGFAPVSCTVQLNVKPLPDNLQVTVFMNDSVDVDVHLTGGVGSRIEDMRFHENHLSSGVESRNCYWNNCAVCSASIEGQTCGVTGPTVDFSTPRGTASYLDPADPQLDIDNVRGCFTATNGERSCVPEKITVEDAPAGTYFAWAYLWGAARSLTEGSLSSPAATTARLEVQCRGQTFSFNRALRSDATTGSSTAAPARSPRRYGGAGGDIKIVIPSNVNAACTVTD